MSHDDQPRAAVATRLAIFDLDGTLTATTAVDTDSLVAAAEQEFALVIDRDWSTYTHCTDAGIAAQSLSDHWGRPATVAEIDRLRDRFIALLGKRRAERPDLYTQTPGAAALVARLADEDWQVCIATGAWRASAQLKIAAAKLPAGLPLFSCDLHPARAAILTVAVAEMRRAKGVAAHDLVVSVGDGVWDVAAARSLGLRFLGIGSGKHARALRDAGAQDVVPDFSDTAGVVAMLEHARAPRRPRQHPRRS